MDISPGKEPVYDALCIVCLKTVRDGDALVHFPFENHFVTVCCPLCMAAFEADPKSYLGRKIPPREDNPSML
jgi:hypothetical protein